MNAMRSRRAAEEAALGSMHEIGVIAFWVEDTANGSGKKIALEVREKISRAFLLITGAAALSVADPRTLLRKDSEERRYDEKTLWTAETSVALEMRKVVGIMGSLNDHITEPGEAELNAYLALLRGRIEDTAAIA